MESEAKFQKGELSPDKKLFPKEEAQILEGPIPNYGPGWEKGIKFPEGVTRDMVMLENTKDGWYWRLKPEFIRDPEKKKGVIQEEQDWEVSN